MAAGGWERRLAPLAVVLGGAGLLLAGPVSAAGRSVDVPTCTATTSGDDFITSPQDINADGYSDLVIGVPHAAVSGLAGAGVIDIRYPHVTAGLSAQRLDESFFGQTPAAHDNFGDATTLTDFQTPSFCHGLAVGAPGADGGRGTVTVAQGSNGGITPEGAVELHGPQSADGFGAGLATRFDELFVAAPDETVAGHTGAGAVYHYHFDTTDRQLQLVQVITENSAGVPGSAAAGDHFGAALDVGDTEGDAGSLAIGAPGKSVDGHPGAGTVTVLTTSDVDMVGKVVDAASESQDSPKVPGGAENGDGFGSSLSYYFSDDLLVGVPGEDLGTVRNAGAIQGFEVEVDSAGLTVRPDGTFTQGSPGIVGASETGDRFGAALAAVQDGDVDSVGHLYVGVPGESIGAVRATGDVLPLCDEAPDRNGFVDPQFRSCDHAIRLGGAGVDNLPRTSQTAAHVGASLGRFARSENGETYDGGETLVVDVPALDSGGVNTGEVFVDPVHEGDGSGFVGGGVYRDSAGPHADEFYGAAANNPSAGEWLD